MEKEMLGRLFKPFEQESATTAQKHGGSGLGLSIVKSLVEMMQGAISVQSEKGKGTTFDVDLPFDIPKNTYNEEKDFSSLLALIVDDDEQSVEYTSIVLERIGVKYQIAHSGEEAVKLLCDMKADNKKFDICFVDWKMPTLNGADVTKKIRELYDEQTTVIVVSAYDVAAVEDEFMGTGVNMFVSKPLFQSTVLNLLSSMTGNTVMQNMNVAELANYDFSGKRCLLAEDNDINTEIAVELLKMVNLTTDTAENGKIAFEKFTQSPANTYDLILMDVQMPVMDGFEATKAIRNSTHPQAKDIQIYAMTANAFTEDVAASLAVGMNGHIAKPIDTKILYATIAKVLGQHN